MGYKHLKNNACLSSKDCCKTQRIAVPKHNICVRKRYNIISAKNLICLNRCKKACIDNKHSEFNDFTCNKPSLARLFWFCILCLLFLCWLGRFLFLFPFSTICFLRLFQPGILNSQITSVMVQLKTQIFSRQHWQTCSSQSY